MRSRQKMGIARIRSFLPQMFTLCCKSLIKDMKKSLITTEKQLHQRRGPTSTGLSASATHVLLCHYTHREWVKTLFLARDHRFLAFSLGKHFYKHDRLPPSRPQQTALSPQNNLPASATQLYMYIYHLPGSRGKKKQQKETVESNLLCLWLN